MKNLVFIVLFGSMFLMSCRQEKYVDRSKSDNYYYSEDRTKILYDSTTYVITFLSRPEYLEVPADINTFEPISEKYGRDKSSIFYKNIQLVNVDRESFYWDDKNELPKDKNHVYLPDTKTSRLTVVEGADPATYERHILKKECLNWYKDKGHYFYNHKITEADRETMSFESVYLPFDKVYIFWVSGNKVFKTKYIGEVIIVNSRLVHDDKYFYYINGCDELNEEDESDTTAYIIPFYDVESFKFYDDNANVFRIDYKIYYRGLELPQADVHSFKKVDSHYFKDKFRVFFKSIYVESCDPETFDIINWKYARDNKNIYRNGKILEGYTPVNFKQDKWGRYPPDDNYGVAPSGRSRLWRDDNY